MIGVDTNVLVRFLVRDDAAQAQTAAAFFRRAESRGEVLYVPQVVLCELVWVLATAYRYPKSEIADVLEQLLRTRQISFEEPQRVREAAARYRAQGGDFADQLILGACLDAGCDAVATFETRLRRQEGFVAPSA